MPRPKGSADLLEDRRKRALALLNAGHSLNEVGRRIGCNASSVMRWRDAWRQWRSESLAGAFLPRPSPWKLKRGGNENAWCVFSCKRPIAQGYRTNLWTTIRIAEVVQRKGVRNPDITAPMSVV